MAHNHVAVAEKTHIFTQVPEIPKGRSQSCKPSEDLENPGLARSEKERNPPPDFPFRVS